MLARVTRRLAEVAKKVGVSEATVSRVLNGKPGVSDATRAAVLTALDVLGYERPTQLRGERARLVGLVLPELQNPIFPAFAEVVGGALAQHGFTPVLCTRTAGGVSEADYVDMLLQQQVSGVVFAGGLYAQADAPHEHYHRLLERGLPAVLVNAAVDDLGFPRVSSDDAVAVGAGVRPPASRSATSGSAWCSARADHMPVAAQAGRVPGGAARPGRVADAASSTRMFSLEGGQAAATPADRATASPASSAPATCWRSARSGRSAGAGLSVPEDVSVVGYDDSALMNCTDPPLTTVRQPIEAMGRAAVDAAGQPDRRRRGRRRRAALRARAGGPRLHRRRLRAARRPDGDPRRRLTAPARRRRRGPFALTADAGPVADAVRCATTRCQVACESSDVASIELLRHPVTDILQWLCPSPRIFRATTVRNLHGAVRTRARSRHAAAIRLAVRQQHSCAMVPSRCPRPQSGGNSLMKARQLAILLAAGLALDVAACGDDATTATGGCRRRRRRPDAKVTITVGCQPPKTNEGERKHWDDDVAAFQKLHPNITIESKDAFPCNDPETSPAKLAGGQSRTSSTSTSPTSRRSSTAGQAADITAYVSDVANVDRTSSRT